MALVNFYKVTSLPGTLAANSIYFVENSTYAETYVTDSSAVAHGVGNTAFIEAVAAPLITTALADFNLIEIVADITARNALSTSRSFLVLVQDASADATVDSGAALYAYNEGTSTFTKIAEYESLDFDLSWGNISGRPSSSPSQIDDAVTLRHSHTNKAVLDLLDVSGGKLTYNGTGVGGAEWTTLNW